MTKRFKFGFTLAEAIVTVGIIGVVAMLVIPSVATGSKNRKNGTALGRSVEIIESGCQSMIQEINEISTFQDLFFGHYMINSALNGMPATAATNSISGANLFSKAGSRKFFDVSQLTPGTTYTGAVKSLSGGTPSPGLSTLVNNYALNSKTGVYYGAQTANEANADDPIVGYIYIDVNGESSPNRYGRDIFYFGLTDRCHMIPAGSARINALMSSIPAESSGCNGSNPTNGLSCTSRVVRNGYKIDY